MTKCFYVLQLVFIVELFPLELTGNLSERVLKMCDASYK